MPPVATATGAASMIASKTSAIFSAKGSCNLVKVKFFYTDLAKRYNSSSQSDLIWTFLFFSAFCFFLSHGLKFFHFDFKHFMTKKKELIKDLNSNVLIVLIF